MNRVNPLKPHWTEEIFVKHAKIYLKIHEEFLKSAPEQARQISKILAKYGVKKNGRILDLGCGIGRHSAYLAKLGYHVVGIDLSPIFLKRAGELATSLGVSRRTKFLQGDYRTLARSLEAVPEFFNAVINMWSTIGYYTDETDIEVLKQCRLHSHRGSILLIETINSDFLAKHFLPSGYTEFNNFLLLEDRKMNFEKARIATKWRFYQKKKRSLTHRATMSFEFRVYTLYELISALGRAGWRFLEAYGGLEEGPLTPDARRLLVIAEAA